MKISWKEIFKSLKLSMKIIDKTNWSEGIWKKEPDEVLWTDVLTRYLCLIKRGPAGHLCGYVGVPKEHPWFGLSHNAEVIKPKDWDNRLMDDRAPIIPLFLRALSDQINRETITIDLALDVHGGVTYSNFWGDQDPNVYWFGFDCGHAGDYCPRIASLRKEPIQGEKYRDIAYVTKEIEALAIQLRNIQNSPHGAGE